MTRTIFTTFATSAALAAALGTTAQASDMPDNFSAIDVNADGQVTYKEYAAQATHVTKTKAAQDFMKISNGNQVFTEGDFIVAASGTSNWNEASQPYTVSEPNTQVLSSGTTTYSGETTTYIEPSPTPQTDMTYSPETSGAYTAPSVSQDEILGDTTSTANPQMQVWEDNIESGAYSPSTPAVTLDPTVDVDVDNPVEETWDDTKDVTSDAWDATKDAASDTMDKAEDLVDSDE